MDFRQMQYLVTLAEEQQFTRAASVCGVSQSGLSAAIRALEDELGITLFDRTTRRVEPTPAGLALLPHARTMLAQAAAARDAVVRTTRELSATTASNWPYAPAPSPQSLWVDSSVTGKPPRPRCVRSAADR